MKLRAVSGWCPRRAWRRESVARSVAISSRTGATICRPHHVACKSTSTGFMLLINVGGSDVGNLMVADSRNRHR